MSDSRCGLHKPSRLRAGGRLEEKSLDCGHIVLDCGERGGRHLGALLAEGKVQLLQALVERVNLRNAAALGLNQVIQVEAQGADLAAQLCGRGCVSSARVEGAATRARTSFCAWVQYFLLE